MLKTVFFNKQQKGSPWTNSFAKAEKWVNGQENQRLNFGNIERSNTKWTFVKLSNIEVKVVLDKQPMLGTRPLPDWLSKLAHSRNLCFWRCIAVYKGARPDRSTQAARALAKSYLNLSTAQLNFPKTSLDELDKVERHLNQGKQLLE